MPDLKYGKHVFWISSAISLIFYILISYLTPRHESLPLLIYYSFLFIAFLLIYGVSNREPYVNYAYMAGIAFRLSLLFLVPNLSDDVYRFIWDGRLTAHGINPYVFPPEHFLSKPGYEDIGLTHSLFDLFGKNTHSSYPPVDQLIFAMAVLISPRSLFGSILVIRVTILAFEAGNILIIRKLLKTGGKPVRLGLLYVLNPLVILELTGNLHFEGIMIFFLLLTLWFIRNNGFIPAGIAVGLSILVKLLPLIFLPYFWIRYRKKGFVLVALSVIIIISGFLPFLWIDSVRGFLESLALYFYKLEFNASIYFLVRQIGYWAAGFNIIWIAGPLLGFLAFLLIIYLSFSDYAKKVRTEETVMWLLMIYLAMTTTLHPWYVITLLVLCIFTEYRFPLVWTFFIFFTYEGYSVDGYQPDYWWIGLEYLVIYGIMLWEIRTVPEFHSSPVTRGMNRIVRG
ncbi:MAG: DUF2029 domain-containing protein [Cyclobacteriaceae bacterium]|nr:DUF2029 domain-containing protein [Cyclobacteriaceae bacterium]